MSTFIQYLPLKLMLFLKFTLLFSSCNASTSAHLKNYEKADLILPSGEVIKTYIARSDTEQMQGLSGIKDKDFGEMEGMLFPMDKMQMRQFWMPDTHFNLDIIFMNADYYIIDIHRNLEHSPFKADVKTPPFSKRVFSQHILEIKSSSPLSKKIYPGMVLKIKK